MDNTVKQELQEERKALLEELKRLQQEEYLILSAVAGLGPYYDILVEPLNIQSEIMSLSGYVREEYQDYQDEQEESYMERYEKNYERLSQEKEAAEERVEQFRIHEQEVEDRIKELKGRIKEISQELGLTPMDKIVEFFRKK